MNYLNPLANKHRAQNGLFIAITLLITTCLIPVWSLAANAPIPAAPKLAARAYLLIDVNSGHILAEKKINKRMEPASLTKLMTAYIVFSELQAGTISLDEEVLISEKAWRTGGSRMFIEVNKRVSIEKLLKGMIIQSGNDASVALAEHIAGGEDAFATLMNSYAFKLGMEKSNFINATGMPHRKHYTTAADLAKLATALIKDFPDYYAWYSIRKYTYNGITQYNRNKLLWNDKHVDGLKTGHTESAGYCLISSALRDSMRLLSVVLGTRSEESRARESQKLLNYGFRFFETRPLYIANTTLTKTRIWEGAVEELALGISTDLYTTIPRGRYNKLKTTLAINEKLMAPVNKGQQYGTLSVTLDDKPIASRPLIALQDVAPGDFIQRMSDKIIQLFE